MQSYDICLVGATGLVGQTFLRLLEEVKFPINRLKLLASKRSAGKTIYFKSQPFIVEELTESSFDGYQLAFFSAGGQVSKTYAPIARSRGNCHIYVYAERTGIRTQYNLGGFPTGNGRSNWRSSS